MSVGRERVCRWSRLCAWVALGSCVTPAEGEPPPEPPPALAQPPAADRAPAPPARDAARAAARRVGAHLHDPGGALAGFYAALARSEAGQDGALTRVLHMGDSSIGLDQLPHMLRSRMQARFGDGGPGFVLLQPHSASYRHQLVHPWVGREWDFCFVVFRCQPDGRYGLGGVTFNSRGGSATRYRTPTTGTLGRRVSRFELWYAAQPRGGRVALHVDDDRPVIVETAAATLEDRWHALVFPPGEHTFQVRAAGGPLRAYGAVLESPGPGVVWDTLSMIGAFTSRLLAQDRDHIAAQVAHRDPDLLVLGYGGNDLRRLAGGGVTAEGFEDEYRRVIRHLRVGKPSMACLVVAINDHGMSGFRRLTAEHVEAIVEAQRGAAAAEGCAFFDTYEAMGGRGSMARWAAHRPPLASGDQKHLSRHGREVIAQQLFDDLMAGYAERAAAPR